eukprot:g3717.t1
MRAVNGAIKNGSGRVLPERLLLLLLAAVQFTHIMDFMVMMPLGPQLMRELRISPQQFGNLISSFSLTAGVVGLLAAPFLDRFDRRKLLLFCYAGFAFGTLACGLSSSVGVLMMCRAVCGAFGGVAGATIMAIVSDVVPAERRAQGMGIIMTSFSAAAALGVPFGLKLAQWWKWEAPFLVVASLAGIVWMMLWFVLPPVRGHLEDEAGLKKARTPGEFLALVKDFNAWRGILLMAMVVIGHFSVIPYLSPFLVHNVGLPEGKLFLVYMVGGLVTIVTGPYIGRMADRYGRLRIYRILVACAGCVILTLTYSGPRAQWEVLVISAAFFIFASGRFIPVQAVVSQAVERKRRGAYMSLISCTRDLTVGISAAVGSMLVVEAEGREFGGDFEQGGCGDFGGGAEGVDLGTGAGDEAGAQACVLSAGGVPAVGGDHHAIFRCGSELLRGPVVGAGIGLVGFHVGDAEEFFKIGGEAGGFHLGLEAVLGGIVVVLSGEEFLVGALLDDFPVIEDADEIGTADGGEAVGDDEGGAVCAEEVECLLDEFFGGVVEGGGGFVEQEDGWIPEEGPCDGDALFFSSGKADAAFSGGGFETFGEGADKFGGVGCLEDGPEFGIGGVVLGEGEVFAQRGVEEEGVLGDEAGVVAEPFLGDFRDGVSIEQDFTGGGFVEAGEEVEQGGFPRSGGADEGDGLAGEGGEVDVAEGGVPGIVGKGDVAELDTAGEGGGAEALGEVGFVPAIDDVEDAFGGDEAFGEGLGEGVDFGDGLEKEAPGDEEGDDGSAGGGEVPVERPPGAEGDHEDDAGLGNEGDGGPDDGLAFHDGHVFVADFPRCGIEIGEGAGLDGVGFDLADAGEIVVEYGIERGGGLGGFPPFGFRFFRPPAGEDADEGEGGENDEGEFPGVVEHVAEHDDELEKGGDGLVEAFDDDAVGGGDVGGDAGHDFPGGILIEPGDGEALEFVVEFDADDVGEFQLQVVVQVGAGGEQDLAEEDDRGAGEGGGEDEVRAIFGDDDIDEAHGDGGEDQDEGGAEHGHEQGNAAEEWEAQGVADDTEHDVHFPVFEHIGPLSTALVLGLVWRAFMGVPLGQYVGIGFSAKSLLRFGIILLGVRLNLDLVMQGGLRILLLDVTVIAFGLTFITWLGLKLGLDATLSCLIAVDSSICGASAVAAAAPALGADDDAPALVIPMCSLIGTAAVIVYTFGQSWLQLDPDHYGMFAGATLHEVAQVMAAVTAVPESLEIGTVTKLTRVVLLVPAVFLLSGWLQRYKARQSGGVATAGRAEVKRGKPWFVLGFLLVGVFNTLAYKVFPDSHEVLENYNGQILVIAKFLMAMAMAGMGLQVDFGKLRENGPRAVVVALGGWVLLAGLAAVEIFTVAEKLNFTRAAEVLHISQPAVTQHIKTLEELYGVALFERGRGGIALTEGGRILLAHAEQVRELERIAEARIRSRSPRLAGPLRIGASMTIAQYFLPGRLGEFQARYPEVSLTLQNGNSEEITGALIAGRVDLALVEYPGLRRDLAATPFYEDEIVCLAATDHPLVGRKKVTAEDLREFSFILREPGSGTRSVVERALKKVGFGVSKMTIAMESSGSETIKGLIAAGLGLGFLSRLAAVNELELGKLAEIEIEGLRITRPFKILNRQGSVPTGPAGQPVEPEYSGDKAEFRFADFARAEGIEEFSERKPVTIETLGNNDVPHDAHSVGVAEEVDGDRGTVDRDQAIKMVECEIPELRSHTENHRWFVEVDVPAGFQFAETGEGPELVESLEDYEIDHRSQAFLAQAAVDFAVPVFPTNSEVFPEQWFIGVFSEFLEAKVFLSEVELESDGVAGILRQMLDDPKMLLIALAAAVCIGLSKAGFSGISLISVVLLAEVYGAKESVGLALPLLIVADLMAYPAFLRHGTWRSVWKLLPATLMGLAMGWVLLGEIDDLLARRLIGSCVLLMIAVQVFRRVAPVFFAKLAESGGFGLGAGVLGGFATMLANAAGPVVQLYLLSRKMPKMEMLGVGARFFLLINLIKLPLNARLATITSESLWENAKLVPGVVLGVIVGRWLIGRVPQAAFEWMIVGFSLFAAVRLLFS